MGHGIGEVIFAFAVIVADPLQDRQRGSDRRNAIRPPLQQLDRGAFGPGLASHI